MQIGRGMKGRQAGARQLMLLLRLRSSSSKRRGSRPTRTCRLLLPCAKRRPSCWNTGKLLCCTKASAWTRAQGTGLCFLPVVTQATDLMKGKQGML